MSKTKQTQKSKFFAPAVLAGILFAAVSAGCSNPAGGNKPSPDTPQSQAEYKPVNFTDLEKYLKNVQPAADGIYYIDLTLTDQDLNDKLRKTILKNNINKHKKIALRLNGVTSIGNWALQGCEQLISVSIPTTVTSIGENAFSYCSKLASVTISNGVVSIGAAAFQDCKSLTSITLPDSVSSIGERAFSGCSVLTRLTVTTANINYRSEQNIIYSKDMKTLVCAAGALTSVDIPNSVRFIGVNAFEKCAALKNVTIPVGVTSIGRSAFGNCTALENIVIPSSVKSIGMQAFERCEGLQHVTISAGVMSIGESAFSACTALKNVTIPVGVTSIGKYAFFGCTALENVVIPSSVTSIGERVFQNCKSLMSVTIPDSVTSIGDTAFSGCTGLEGIFTLPPNLQTIGRAAFKDSYNIERFDFTACMKLTQIAPDAFDGCGSVVKYRVTAASGLKQKLLGIGIPESQIEETAG
ncbi:leucine-rich repeat domain-containing protein [Treponema maltophilum]|uniref:leucine-rich repeat domain-containing protein n=1 Tax=Treponema maltophilum TaxID=51160 RepID=UPI003D933656